MVTKNDTSVDPKQQYISELSKTGMYEAAHEVSSCSLWSTPSEHSDIYAALIGHHHLAHEHTQMQHAEMQHAKTATSNCSSERPSHVVFHVHVIGTLLWTLHWS